MIINSFAVEQEKDLVEIINRYVDKSSFVALQAGHFILAESKMHNKVIPCIFGELTSENEKTLISDIGNFPLLTWKLGVDILSSLQAGRKEIFTIVNDWQYMNNIERRKEFYMQNSSLFKSYESYLMQKGNSVNLFSQRSLGFKTASGVWISEVTLANQFNRSLSKFIKRNQRQDVIDIEKTEKGIEYSYIDNLDSKHLLYCGGKRGNCRQELAEINRQLLDLAGFTVFINIYPISCQSMIKTGTDWAYDLIIDKGITINVGLNSTHVNQTRDLFYKNEVTIHGNERI